MSQRIIFDTSGINRLAKDSDSEPLIAALGCGYNVGLTAMSVDELLAPRNVEYRKRFVHCCLQISQEVVCLMQAGLLIQTMIANYSRNPDAFNWTLVNVRLKFYEDALIHGEEIFTDEELSAEQRKFAEERSATFEDWFTKLRPKLQKIYEDAGEKPHAYTEVLRLSQDEGGIIWGFAKELYRGAQEWNIAPDGPVPNRNESERIPAPDDEIVKRFVNACPPFRAVVIAFMLTWYDRCLRENHAVPKFKAGCVDQYMAVYLPYCHQFITNDQDQQKCLQEVASICGLNTQVSLYDNFYKGFMVLASECSLF